MLWVELEGEIAKSTKELEPRGDKTIEVNEHDLEHTVEVALHYKADPDNMDRFITGVGMELALKLLGLWPKEMKAYDGHTGRSS